MKIMREKCHYRLFTHILCALLLLSALCYGAIAAAEAGTITEADKALFANLVEANSFAEMNRRHDSKRIDVIYYDENDEDIQSFMQYVDSGKFVEEVEDENGHIVMDTLFLWAGMIDEEPYLQEVFLDREEAYIESLSSRQDGTSLTIEPEEVLVEVQELNGCWYITTEVSDSEWIRAFIESDAENAEIDPVYPYTDGMKVAFSYTFNEETKDLLEIWVVLRDADGTEHSYALERTSYDVAYDISSSMFAPYFSATDYSTITLVFAHSTPEEYTMTYAIPKEEVYWSLEYQGEEYTGDIYMDPDYTQIYTGGRPDEITLYIPAQS